MTAIDTKRDDTGQHERHQSAVGDRRQQACWPIPFGGEGTAWAGAGGGGVVATVRAAGRSEASSRAWGGQARRATTSRRPPSKGLQSAEAAPPTIPRPGREIGAELALVTGDDIRLDEAPCGHRPSDLRIEGALGPREEGLPESVDAIGGTDHPDLALDTQPRDDAIERGMRAASTAYNSGT